MTGTYRKQILYVQDGTDNRGNNGRKSRRKNRLIDRRIKRREHHQIIDEALYLMSCDVHDDMIDEAIMYAEDNWYDDSPMDYPGFDYSDLDYPDDTFINDPFLEYDDYRDDPFDNYDHRDREEIMTKHVIEPEDVGRSLGDILKEIKQMGNGYAHY